MLARLNSHYSPFSTHQSVAGAAADDTSSSNTTTPLSAQMITVTDGTGALCHPQWKTLVSRIPRAARPGCRKLLTRLMRRRQHSAWSESSAASPIPRGGHRKGEKVGTGVFVTLQRRGPQGRTDIWGYVFVESAERDEWRGPQGRAEGLVVVVLWRKEDRAERP